MRALFLVAMIAIAARPLPAPIISSANLARRIQVAENILVGHLASGTTLASGSEVSSDVMLQVNRVLKGNLIPGTTIPAHLEGRGLFLMPAAKETPAQPFYGIWFLNSDPRRYTIVTREGGPGELGLALAILPEGAPAGEPGDTPAESVANELAAALRWLAATRGPQLNPHVEPNGAAAGRFRDLAENLRTLDASTTSPVYREFASDKSPALRALGIAGLIAANEPEGVRRAAADWSELATSVDMAPIVRDIMAYANVDAAGVEALNTLALREPSEKGLRESASYALRAIHSKEALPALVALLDDKEERVRANALSGFCLFVRNAPAVTPASVPSMSWLQSRQPAPFLDRETERFCFLGGLPNESTGLDLYASFWKSWWQQHRAEIER